MNALLQWWQSRVPIRGEQLQSLTNEPVPNHLKRWWFCLGGTPAYLFIIQIFTGILLAFYYQPSGEHAYESVETITNTVTLGWYFRSLHKWAATFMIAAIILHQTRVYFTAAYRNPRELNWVVGMLLLLCALMAGFTGYSLVFEQLSFWAATVGANISETVPIVGPIIKRTLLGGDVYSAATLPRFYVLHAAILPGAMVALLGIHVMFIRLHGITELKFEDEADDAPTHFNFFPDHVMSELILGLILMVVLSVLATIEPAGLGAMADPLTTPEVIKPEWFFLASFRWLKMFSVTFAVLSMGLIFATMVAWPWIDAVICKVFKYKDASFWIGVVVSVVLIALTTWEGFVKH